MVHNLPARLDSTSVGSISRMRMRFVDDFFHSRGGCRFSHLSVLPAFFS